MQNTKNLILMNYKIFLKKQSHILNKSHHIVSQKINEIKITK